MPKLLGPLAWAYLIIVGLVMITPKGPIPISLEGTTAVVLGAIAIALGGAAFIASRSGAAARI